MNNINIIDGRCWQGKKKSVQRKFRRNEDLIYIDSPFTDIRYTVEKHNIDYFGGFEIQHGIYLYHKTPYIQDQAVPTSFYDFISIWADEDLTLVGQIPYEIKDNITFSIDEDGDLCYELK